MFMQSLSSAAMEKAMGGVWQRMTTISHNLANEDTPGFKAKRVDFETSLKKEIESLRSARNVTRRQGLERLEQLQPEFYEDESTIGRADGNNVNQNAEMIELTRTQMHYQMLSQSVSSYYATLKYAITGG